MVAIIILLQVCGGNKLSKFNVRSFVIYQLGYGLTSFNKDSSANFSGEKSTIKISKVSILRVYVKKLSHGSYNFRQTHFKYFSRTNYSFQGLRFI